MRSLELFLCDATFPKLFCRCNQIPHSDSCHDRDDFEVITYIEYAIQRFISKIMILTVSRAIGDFCLNIEAYVRIGM